MGETIDKLKSFDMFRVLPSKVTEQTVFGSLLGLLTIIASAYLVFYEMSTSIGSTVKTELVFSNMQMEDLQVTMDIDLIHVVCDLIDLRFVSRRGKDHSIKRIRMANGGSELGELVSGRSIDEIEQSLRQREYCKVRGTFYKHFIMNTFFVTFSNPQIIAMLLMRDSNFQFDLSHKINSLYLGESMSHEYYERKYGINGFNRLGGVSRIEPNRATGERITYKHTYFIQAVPTIFDGFFWNTEIFQYTASEYSKPGNENALAFITELNPTSIHYYMESAGIWGLLLQLFSAIGGIFMIIKVIDAMVFSIFCKSSAYTEVDPGTELSGF